MDGELIRFRDRQGVVENKRPGILIGEDLVVGLASFYDTDHLKIFNLWTGKPIIPNRFSNQDDAVKLAAWLNTFYSPFWKIVLNKDWAELDVIRVCQWSIDPPILGIQISLALSDLENQDTITYSQFETAWVAAESRALEYARSYAYDPYGTSNILT